ncbi:MAG TPA: chromate efflux transporter [Baekduia sp.]|uniref:chromate efflux transporter n=1 Tax=Baekduia sp. TaxID=2600305 RepID=UPI002C6F0863|nr:chromate efflux transporter [Baekduia sp.]HMJ35142.1 chromate efflux transporter [Baekduia sp.]
MSAAVAPQATARPSLSTIAREWGRIGCLGFGGPPVHIALLRDLCVTRRRWIRDREFEDTVAAVNLLPGPASTQLAIACAHRLRGRTGALVGGAAFILPGLALILLLAAAFLAGDPPRWLRGAGAGAGAAVAAVAVRAGVDLIKPSWARAAPRRGPLLAYILLGAISAATVGPFLVLVLLACGVVSLALKRGTGLAAITPAPVALLLAAVASTGGLGALAWTAFKVGALSYGGGFVIIPLMQADAVTQHHWMTDGQFLNAVALGQVTPGPVVQTVAVVGYAAAGVGGGLLAALVAFSPSFLFVVVGANRFHALLANRAVRAFIDGAAPAALGAILGSAIPLALALSEPWQLAVLAAAATALLLLRRGVVATLVAAGGVGAAAALAGASLPG